MGRLLQLLGISIFLPVLAIAQSNSPSCPAGQSPSVYTITSVSGAGNATGTGQSVITSCNAGQQTSNLQGCLQIAQPPLASCFTSDVVTAGATSTTYNGNSVLYRQYVNETTTYTYNPDGGCYSPTVTNTSSNLYGQVQANYTCAASSSCNAPQGAYFGIVSQDWRTTHTGNVEVCKSNCIADIVLDATVQTSSGITAMEYWESTGASCTGTDDPTDSTTPDANGKYQISSSPPIYTDAQNNSLSFNDQSTNEGTQPSPTVPLLNEDGCITSAGGGIFCVAQSPLTPDTGTPGTPAQPTVTITVTPQGCNSASCQITYYDQQTVLTSTNDGAGGTQAGICSAGDTKDASGQCQSTGQCPAGQQKNGAGYCSGSGNVSSCGGPGQPVCNVNIVSSSPGAFGNGTGDGSGGCGTAGQPACNTLSGGTDCATPPICTGDPILCNTDYQTWKIQCGTQSDIDTAITAGIQAENSGSSDLLNSANGTVIDVGAMYQSQQASTATLQDIIINMGGWAGTVTVPMSQWSDFLHWIGILVLISANLVGIRIVMTG